MDVIMKKLSEDGFLLKEIAKKEQTLEMCKVAISENPMALQYASRKYIDAEVCLIAVKKDGNAFRYVPERFKTKEMYMLAIKEEAYLLNDVPKELRSKDLCLLAVTNDPEAFFDTPKEIRYEIFDEETPLELLESIIKLDIKWLKYMPTYRNGIDICLSYIKEDFFVSQYLSMEMQQNYEILEYQKSQGKIDIIRKYYNLEEELFIVEVKVIYDITESFLDNMKLTYHSYTAMAKFKDFDKFYNFVEGNLYDAELRTYKFEGINLNEYNIKGAVIHQDVLVKQGLFDGSYFEDMKKRMEAIDLSEVEKNEICIQKGFNYPKPVDEYEQFDNSKTPFFYISDIHLCHRVLHMFKEKATNEEVRFHIKNLVKKMVQSIGAIPDNSYLLIAGDTSAEFELAKIFYEQLVIYWKAENVIVIHGNHELRDPWDEIENNIKVYRQYFKEIGITFLQNDLLLVKERYRKLILNEEKLLELKEKELRELIQDCSIAILGGIGFSGLNDKYNAINIPYGKSFDKSKSTEEILKRDAYETFRFNTIYRKLLQSLPLNKIIVLTHMQKLDWNEDSYNPNWIYINGHTHHNYFHISNEKVIYADNQIGYKTETLGLKYFYIDNEYDIFTYLQDGIHKITKNQYLDFNKGKLVHMSFARDNGQIYLIKKNGKYMFFIYCLYSKMSNNKYLYLLNGGKLGKLSQNRLEDLQYYYDIIDIYVKNIDQLLSRYTGTQQKVSKFIKRLGGSGKIHGCIVDVDKPGIFETYSYCHLFVNPIDGRVTPYFAYDVKSRIVYKDFKELLQSQECCKLLQDNYTTREKEMNLNIPTIQYSSQLEEWGDENSIYDEGSYLYKISRIIKSLQYVTGKNIIRIWNEELVNCNLVNNIKKANRIENMINDKLILKIDSE